MEPANETVSSIIDRAKAIILNPKETWPVIEQETTPSGEIFTRYAMPLAAIGPVAGFLGGQLFGYGAFGIRFHPSFMGSLSMAIGSYILTLIGIFVLSFVANKIAPNFGGEASSRNAFKLVVYSMTAGWLASIFGLIPSLAFLSIVGLYSFYLFYTGAGPLLKVPAEKALTFTIVTVIAMFVVYLCIGALQAGIGRMFGGGISGGDVDMDVSSVSIPGIGKIETSKSGDSGESSKVTLDLGNSKAVAPGALQALLPASIGSYQRTSIESVQAGPGSQAEANYEGNGKQFKLQVSDMAVVGAMAGLAGALGVEANKEDATSYERTTTKDGNLIVEKWDRSSNHGSFMTMVGKRFMIEAEGETNSVDELKAAVATIDPGKLAARSKE